MKILRFPREWKLVSFVLKCDSIVLLGTGPWGTLSPLREFVQPPATGLALPAGGQGMNLGLGMGMGLGMELGACPVPQHCLCWAAHPRPGLSQPKLCSVLSELGEGPCATSHHQTPHWLLSLSVPVPAPPRVSHSICPPAGGFPIPSSQPGSWERGRGEGDNWVAAGLCVNYTSEAVLLLQKLLIIIIIIRALGEKCAEIREASRRARPELISHFYLRISKHLDIN